MPPAPFWCLFNGPAVSANRDLGSQRLALLLRRHPLVAFPVDRLQVGGVVYLSLGPAQALCFGLAGLVVHLCGWQRDKALGAQFTLAQVHVAGKDDKAQLVPCSAVPSGVSAFLTPRHTQRGWLLCLP